jgi:bifunctional DNase/RNase
LVGHRKAEKKHKEKISTQRTLRQSAEFAEKRNPRAQPGMAVPQGKQSAGMGEGAMEVEMKIRGLMMDPVTQMPIVVLKDVQGQSVLPIWVGAYEANAIALEIEKVSTPRPMTHDLLKNVLLGLDVHVQKIVVNDLRDDTFFALIWVEREGELISIDSRPSDALALALRVDCPIFVDETVLKNSKVATALAERSSNEQLRNYLEGLSDEDLGRYKM